MFFGFGICGVRDRREKAFRGRVLEATASALVCLYLIFTDSTKSTLNKTLLFSRPVGWRTGDIKIVKNWYFQRLKIAVYKETEIKKKVSVEDGNLGTSILCWNICDQNDFCLCTPNRIRLSNIKESLKYLITFTKALLILSISYNVKKERKLLNLFSAYHKLLQCCPRYFLYLQRERDHHYGCFFFFFLYSSSE